MKLRLLLINPWIYDFAAYNLWARPLGLLKVAEFLSSFNVELILVDCTDSAGSGRFGTGHYDAEIVPKPAILREVPRHFKKYGISIPEFQHRLKSAGNVDLVLITSIMGYWYPGVQKAVELVRNELGTVPVILGGIYATIYHEHASRYSGADFIFRGPLNNGLLFAMSTFGFKIKRKRGPVPYYRLGFYDHIAYAPLLTSTGCPFRCDYCASSLLASRYERCQHDEIIKNIVELSEMDVHDFAFYDDALLEYPEEHIKPLLRNVLSLGLQVRFHTPNGMHARYMDAELAGLMRASGFRTIRLSLETTNPERQLSSGGKVCNEELESAVGHLFQAGFTKNEIGIYIMYGLPGQGLEEVKESISFLKRLGVRVNLTEFAPVRGTNSWKELANKGTITDDLDPLLTNNTVFTSIFSGYYPEDVAHMKIDVNEYNAR